MARPTDRRRGRAVGDYTTSRTATFRVRSPGGNLSWFLSRQDVHVLITRGGRTACVRACVVCAPRPAEAHFLNTFQRSCWFFQRATTIYFFGHRQFVVPTSPSTHNRCHLRHTTLVVVAMAPKRLTVGWPIDFSADVPILPPFALLLTFLSSLVMWFVTKKRLRWLAWPIDSKWVRIAAFVGAASVVASVADAASKALDEAGSGVNFTEVTGLAVDFPFDGTRNPMYAVLLFVATPALAMAMAPKRLTVGWPIDFSADVPILPPFALLLTFLSSLVMWFVTKKRLRWLAWPIDSKWVRIAAFVGAASVVASVADAASKALDEAGSGVNFTEVTGLAVDFPFDGTRNPMYAVLLFVATPALAMLIDSAWPFVFLPLLYAYISDIVIVAEEKLLLETFGKAYATYAKETPRLSVTGVWRAKDED